MIKIEWYNEKIQDEYVEEISKKIKPELNKEICTFPVDIANIFKENGLVSQQKIKNFLKMKYSEIESIDALKTYIERRNLILKCLKSINQKDYKNWIKLNPNSFIKDYLNERFNSYNKKYPMYSLIYPDSASKNQWDGNYKNQIIKTVLSEPFDKVFNYKELKPKLRHKLIDSLNVSVCPFCNRQYITSWEDRHKDKKSTADLDHFFPKSNYSLFALSLFNFIPSCQVCNSRMKSSDFLDDEGHRPIYPFEEAFGDAAVFKANVSDKEKDPKKLLDVWLSENTDDLKIQLKIEEYIEPQLKEKINSSNKLYHLEEVYQEHKNYVSELMLKKRIYNDGEYLKTLQNIFKELNHEKFNKFSEDIVYSVVGTELIITQKQLELFLYGYNWKNGQDVNRPLSKLTYDILKR